jgi:RNA polymerase sigma-70 factor (ECF subfamily)
MTLRRSTPRKPGLLARSRTTPRFFADFYEATCEAMYGFFLRETGNEQVALDLVGETYAVAFEKRCEFRGVDDQQGASWLWKIARNNLKMHKRSKVVEVATIQKVGWERQRLSDEDEPPFEQAAVAGEVRGHLAAALARLPADQLHVLQLRYGRELDYAEIAGELGVTSAVARNRAFRALRALKASHHLHEIRLLRRT